MAVVNEGGVLRADCDDLQKGPTVFSTEIGLLCFSKNRPFQLEQLLISIKSFIGTKENDITIIVLYSPGNDVPVRL